MARRDRQLRSAEQEFLPAALEVMERPPSPVGRAIAWTVVMLFGIAAVWAYAGKVDVVTVASGSIIPSGRIKAIQAAQLGVVTQIHVTEGLRVVKGQLLVELDPTTSRADQIRIAGTLESLVGERDRLGAYSRALERHSGIERPLTETTKVAGKDEANRGTGEMTLQDRILNDQWAEYLAIKASAQNEVAVNLAEQGEVEAALEKLRAVLPLVTERAAAMKKMMDRELAPRIRWNELEQARIEMEKETIVLEHRMQQLRAKAGQIQQEFVAREARLQKEVHARLAEVSTEVAGLQQELVKAESLSRRQRLVAPVSGMVHRLAIHSVDGVVKPGETLMNIVPDNAELEVEAWVRNRDIGFIEVGQEAEVKVETFPFTKYGTVPGRIEALSHDAVADAEGGFAYRAKVVLQRSSIDVGNNAVNLAPGMTVMAEIKTGERRMIEYFMSPLLRYRDEFARER